MNNSYHIPGVIVLDGFLHSFAQGIILTQAFKYWDDFTDDSRRKRLFVLTVVSLVIMQTVLEDWKVWRLTINQDWWNSSLRWSDIFLDGLICSLCESFFIRRCWKLMNKNNWILLPLCLLALSTFVANIYLAVAVQVTSPSSSRETLEHSLDFLPSTIVAFSYWTYGSLVLDLTITSTLIFRLWQSRTGFANSDRVLYHVIVISWESALVPSIFMLTAASIYHANPTNPNYYLIRFFLLATGKLYTIGLLRTLNSRVKLRERMKSHDLGRVSLGDWQWNQPSINQPPPPTSTPSSLVPSDEPPSCPPITRSYSVTSRTGVAPRDVHLGFGSPRGSSRYMHSHVDE